MCHNNNCSQRARAMFETMSNPKPETCSATEDHPWRRSCLHCLGHPWWTGCRLESVLLVKQSLRTEAHHGKRSSVLKNWKCRCAYMHIHVQRDRASLSLTLSYFICLRFIISCWRTRISACLLGCRTATYFSFYTSKICLDITSTEGQT